MNRPETHIIVGTLTALITIAVYLSRSTHDLMAAALACILAAYSLSLLFGIHDAITSAIAALGGLYAYTLTFPSPEFIVNYPSYTILGGVLLGSVAVLVVIGHTLIPKTTTDNSGKLLTLTIALFLATVISTIGSAALLGLKILSFTPTLTLQTFYLVMAAVFIVTIPMHIHENSMERAQET